MSQVDDDIVSNPTDNPRFSDILEAALSRRTIMIGGVAAAATTFLGSRSLAVADVAPVTGGGGQPPLIGFTGIATSTADTVVVPPGYTARVLISWGDPLSHGPAFLPDAGNTVADQERQWGMHNDGVHFFPFPRGYRDDDDDDDRDFDRAWTVRRGLLVQNHEYTDDGLLFPDGVANWSAAKTAKSLAAHGVSVIQLRRRRRDGWQVKRPSRFARRITGSTPITIGGPAAGHPLLRTSADPRGRRVLGTLNNCAHGWTPWNTYLACEENFNGYFRTATAPAPGTLAARYGLSTAGFGYLWHTTPGSRFQVENEPNEPNRFGWVTEIDPFRPGSTPVKRTALGRVKHEGAWVVEDRTRRVVVYMGDDERFEYIYRYVSNKPWPEAFRRNSHPLDDGILYVGKFNADGSGEWLPLTADNPALSGFSGQADILIRTRQAADLLGATRMDRPEWIDVDLRSGFVYCTLTNNSRRGASGQPPTDPPNPRVNNVYGHIIRWRYRNDFSESTFRWEIFALGGDPTIPAHGSTIIGDKYGSPDGLYVSPAGRLWIQTDVSTSTINAGAYAGFGNNQMLGADPATRETRRFLVGPRQCEITGVVVTPDEQAMFVGIQHPGERPDDMPGNPANPKEFSSWPDGPAGGRPRSSTLVITKNDGGPIGS
ncbi:MAG: PhoX family protein [Pseudonocardiaceae bacterium]